MFINIIKAIVFTFFASITSLAAAETWLMSTHAPDGNYHTINAVAFAKDVEQLSDGELVIEVRSNSILAKRSELKRAVQKNIVPIGEVLISALENEDAAYAVDAVPLLATTFNDAKKLWDASKGVYDQKLSKQGLMSLYSVPWPPQGVYMKKPISSSRDFEGIRFRAYNASTARLAELLGAVPSTIASSEISQAFAAGVISGMITSPTTGVDSQAWDFVEHYYDVKAFLPKNFVLVNQRAFKKLSKKSQNALLDASSIAEKRGWGMAMKATQEATDTLKSNGMTVSETPADLATNFAEIGDTMLKEWKKRAGNDAKLILDAFTQN